jgi:hypothetical protein
MTPRSIRRAAERKAKKLARKAEQAAAVRAANHADPINQPVERCSPVQVPLVCASDSFEQKLTTPAQLAANRANAQLSTGPRTSAGLAKSSKNAVKSALTGQTVLLPTDNVAEYASFLDAFQRDLKPVGQTECELVQIIVDCFWRLRRINALEFALYTHGHSQFEHAFDDQPEENRAGMILLQTHMTYEKQFRNWHIQEGRLDRKRAKAMTELQRLQLERKAGDTPAETQLSDAQLFLGAGAQGDSALRTAQSGSGYVPPDLAPYVALCKPVSENGFVFSNGPQTISQESI